MEMLTIEINNPKAKRLIDDLADLGLISVKETKPSWNERWQELAKFKIPARFRCQSQSRIL
jgi:hypothetical protein